MLSTIFRAHVTSGSPAQDQVFHIIYVYKSTYYCMLSPEAGFMHSHVYVVRCMHVGVRCVDTQCWCLVSSSITLHFIYWDRIPCWTQSSLIAPGIPCFCLNAGITGSSHTCPTFMWVLEVWTSVLILVKQVTHPLSHLFSPRNWL